MGLENGHVNQGFEFVCDIEEPYVMAIVIAMRICVDIGGLYPASKRSCPDNAEFNHLSGLAN